MTAFYEMARSAWDAERETDEGPVSDAYPLMLNRYGAETIHAGSSTVYLYHVTGSPDALEGAGASRVADDWGELWSYLDANDAPARDEIFRAWVEEQDEDGGLVRRKMTHARAKARGHKAKAGRRPGADFVRGEVGPPNLPDQAVEGIASAPVLPMRAPGEDEVASQENLDAATGA